MSAKIVELKDKADEYVYPITNADAVYMPNAVDTVGRFIRDLDEHGAKIVFGNNVITKTLETGTVVETRFYPGSIVETTTTKRSDESVTVTTKTTTFKSDGSIEIEVK